MQTNYDYRLINTLTRSEKTHTQKKIKKLYLYCIDEHLIFLPYNPKIIAIKVPGLHGVLIVLEDDFDEVVEIGLEDGRGDECRAVGGKGLDGVVGVDPRDVEVVGQLKRGVRIDVGRPVDRVALLAIYQRRRIGQNKRLCDRNFSIVV